MSHRRRRHLVVLAGLALACAGQAFAQTSKPPAARAKVWKAETVLPLTCAQAWIEAGRTYPGLLAIVETLARVSLGNRDLTFPNTREAGIDAGTGIVADCKADPHALLFSIVDKHVRRIAESSGTPR